MIEQPRKGFSGGMIAEIAALKAENAKLRGALELIGSQAKVCILNEEEEWDMSANWVERRCRKALG